MLSVTALNLIPKALGPNQENFLQVIIGIALGGLMLSVETCTCLIFTES
jgi:hypothetical protein